jgi:hypothetical protein
MRKAAERVRARVDAEQLEVHQIDEPAPSKYAKRNRRSRRSRSSNRRSRRKNARTRLLELQASDAVPLVGKLRDVGFVLLLRRCVSGLEFLLDKQPRGEVWKALSERERQRWAFIRRSTESSVLRALRELLEVATPDESIERDAAARRTALSA